MIRNLILAIALVLACGESASAAPAIMQQVCSPIGGGNSIVFASAPTNGNVVAVEIAYPGAVTMKDSNNVSYTVSSDTGTALAANTILIDGVVAGSPNATFQLTPSALEKWCAYEISGVGYPGTYQNIRVTSTVSSQGLSANPIPVGAVSICVMSESANGIFSLAFQVSSTVADQNLANALWAHTYETTTLEQCRATNTGGSSDVALLYAYYSTPLNPGAFIGSSSFLESFFY